MTAIDHPKARRLIQAALSLPLSEKDRDYLDMHLDGCAECREYAGQLAVLETHLRQSFHARWDSIPGPPAKLTHAIPEKTGARLTSQRILGYGGPAALTIILVAMLIFAISMIPERSFPLSQNQTTSTPENNASPSITPFITPQANAPAATENALEEPIITPTSTPWGQEVVSASPLEGLYPELIAFTSYRDGSSEIYVLHPNEDRIQNLTNDPAADYHLEWSPDGRRLAFISSRGNAAQIFTIDLESERLTRLTQSSEVKSVNLCSKTTPVNLGVKDGFLGPAWSPDGEYLVASLAMNIEGNMFEPLYLVHTDGSGIVQLTMGNDINSQWSPDGKTIAFNRLADYEGGGHDIYSIQSDGSGLANLTASEASEASAFTWSPDGRQIAYFSTSGGNETEGRTALKLMDADGSNQVNLLDLGSGKIYSGSLAWSPDGNWLAFAAGLDEPAIYALNVGNTNQPSEEKTWVRSTPPGGQYTYPRWQPVVSGPISHANQLETLVEADLNCDGTLERILVEPGNESHYFNNNPTYVRVLMETVSGQSIRSVWEFSAQDASVAYFTPKIIQVEGCQQFLAVLSDEGTGSGLRVFQWDGEGMKELLRVPGRYLFAGPEIIEGMGITAPPGSLSIMDLVHSDAKNLWVVRVFQWDGGEFRQIFQKEVSYPGGG